MSRKIVKFDESRQINESRNYNIAKQNKLVREARYNLSTQQLKVLAFIFSKIKPDDTELKEYAISVEDYCKIAGIDYDNGGNYAFIKRTLRELADESFWWKDETTGDEILVRWLQDVRLRRSTGTVYVKLHERIQQYVIGLTGDITIYQLFAILALRSNYAIRIYELLKSYQYRESDSYIFDLDELKRLLMAEHYTNFKDFRRSVLEVAEKEINRYTDLFVSWEGIRKGKKVIQVKFTMETKDVYERLLLRREVKQILNKEI